jgi:predicted TIM-barrel fold metal-dependent hydrolase
MLLEDFRPKPSLVARRSHIVKPRFPVVDAHNHLFEGFGDWTKRPLSELFALLDEAGVQQYWDLDGAWGEHILEEHLDYFKAAAPERFAMFGGVDWSKWGEHGNRFGDWAAQRLRAQVSRGAQGLKVWKPFGLQVCDQHGELVAVDDPRLDAIWQTAGELKIPVTLHLADPVAFFEPVDGRNERWEELQGNPDWVFTSPPYPPFTAIMTGLANLVQRHPQTIFIGAHTGCYAENLGWVGEMIERCPNYYIDISARLGELGRQPYTARRFFIQHAGRILFGTDSGPSPEDYRLYYRFLESEDEYFNYNSGEVPGQGRWYIYGIHLPDDVLEKVYHRNAEKLIS